MHVAIVGSGPAALYAADELLKQDEVHVTVIDRLPTPHGLVRCGVAPDHVDTKSIERLFRQIEDQPGFHYLLNVEVGTHVSHAELLEHCSAVIYATGASQDRKLQIPGESLLGSETATEFVAWYNGHPDYRDCEFDLSQESVAVVGVGNVAVDVARILCRTPEELLKTDIADYALEQLRASRVKEVTILGRRGPAQAAFTAPEAKELGELADCDTFVPADEAELVHMTYTAAEYDAGPIAFRYPRGNGTGVALPEVPVKLEIGKGRVVRSGKTPMEASPASSGTRLVSSFHRAN